MKFKLPLWFKNRKCKADIVDILQQFQSELSTERLILKKEHHLMTKYFNNIPIIYTIVTDDGVMVRFNKSFRKITCVDNNCMGENISIYIHHDDIKEFSKFINELTPNSTRRIITRIISKKGELTYVKWGGVKLKDEQLSLLFGQDFTKEVKLNDQMEQYLSYKNQLLNNYPGAIITTDIKGLITEFNNKALEDSGYTDEELMGHHIFDIIPEKNLFDETNLNKLINVTIKKKNGDVLNRYLLFLPLLNSSKLNGYFGIWYDETYVEYIQSVFLIK